ncbi:ThuA domain-containing protein [Streptomyces sp. DH37]|uniref:ThuA domain-containing protein n=1 Tax=Streptomyces sp. DH37 TaxID=3040122 RepID=UPI00244328FA|nr:ThuA domain-containing protein [Streptomyces sp. DH37]MDG9701395.1 ThuA domain-containing protein [Streptomyces sp. DH37]
MTISVTVWTECGPDDAAVSAVYPEGMHGAIAGGLAPHADLRVRTATMDEEDHGLGGTVLDETDVLFWWGHNRHDEVDGGIVARVRARVLEGMGLVALHSSAESAVFRSLMGTSGRISGWRHGDREVVWTVDVTHPVAAGVPQPMVIPEQEMYAEPFDVPAPDELVFLSSFAGGEVFRSGIAWRRGLGRVLYFSPGHEEYPVYRREDVRTVLANAAFWAAGAARTAGSPAPAPAPPWTSRPRERGWYER